jgi:hypothetical protein
LVERVAPFPTPVGVSRLRAVTPFPLPPFSTPVGVSWRRVHRWLLLHDSVSHARGGEPDGNN